jgi:hypothetical protein
VKPDEEVKQAASAKVKDMTPPTGIELDVKPPLVTRLRKRPGWIVCGVLFLVSSLICYTFYERQKGLAHSGSASDEKRVEPATHAGQEIAKDIPQGVINLADEGKKTESDNTRSGTLAGMSPSQPDVRGPSGAIDHKAAVGAPASAEPVRPPFPVYQTP